MWEGKGQMRAWCAPGVMWPGQSSSLSCLSARLPLPPANLPGAASLTEYFSAAQSSQWSRFGI